VEAMTKNSEFKPNYPKVAEEMGFASGMRHMFHHACSFASERLKLLLSLNLNIEEDNFEPEEK
jgi:hypothetical protein